ncbi:DUF732 domain-containing protein [Mycobacterium ostraviense]|nr:DUF732 domain-containing protein [Mycobacterium ostraviense]UGT94460.1 DUF732 domain-containing protein [Mycobacterium ostraviense]
MSSAWLCHQHFSSRRFEFDLGRQKPDVATDVTNSSNLDGYRAGYFVGVSIAAYCPRHHTST